MPRTLPNILFAKETDKSAQCQLFHLVVVEDPKQIVSTMHYVDSNYDVTYNGQLYEKFPLKFSGISVSSDGSIDKASITVANAARVIMPLVEAYDGLAGFTVSVITVYEKFLDFVYTMSIDGTLGAVVNTVAYSTAHIRDEFVIDSYTATEQTIVFQLNAVVDFDIRVPRRRFTPFSCYWRYKEASTCQYVGTLATVTGGVVSIPGTVEALAGLVGRSCTFGLWSTTVASVATSAIPDSVDLTFSPVIDTNTVPIFSLADCKKSLEDCQLHGMSERYGGWPGVPSDVRRLFL